MPSSRSASPQATRRLSMEVPVRSAGGTAPGSPRLRARRARPSPALPAGQASRPDARGKYLYVGGRKLHVQGVTYGTFAPGADGRLFPGPDVVDRDFGMMAAIGVNAVRTYTPPPRWLLDRAAFHGLRVMIGLPWEQHVAFLDDRRLARDIRRRIAEGVRACRGHPAVLCYSIGNEIPSPVVRWHGRARVERFLETLCRDARQGDPDGLFTYVNFPTTEYLELPFLDLFCFNVYLEERRRLEAYLARLHNLAGDRPVVLTEVGLDSARNGLERQADLLDRQIRSIFRAGCAGAFVFAWTDEWWRGGDEIHDWSFGLTTRGRDPKPALASVRRAFDEVPLEPGPDWPKISVVICTYNGGATVGETVAHLWDLDYPDYEIVVVNDGSEAPTVALLDRMAEEGGLRVVHTPNRGLAAARNTGWEQATGEIVAYIDDDAFPDRAWLTHLAIAFRDGGWAGVGGPNIIPPEDGLVAHAVAHSPGGPSHVLLDDVRAEHIPGCNMAFRREWLERIGGFDARFRAAGDDVDICWAVQEAGGEIGFHPGAVVWHHRRGSLRRYWKQQAGYGKAEALLEEKWPGKYNTLGHVAWTGRIYGPGLTRALLRGARRRIYQGTWGSAPFQPLYERRPGSVFTLPLTPEWVLLVAALAVTAALGLLWSPLVLAVPVLVLAAGVSVVQALVTALDARLPSVAKGSRWRRWRFRGLVASLHLLQPAARLWGRLKHGLTPWRSRCPPRWTWPSARERQRWSESWRGMAGWLGTVQRELEADGVPVLVGGEYDRWDLEARAGMFGAARLLFAVEEHGGGRQMGRFRVWSRLRKVFFLTGPPAFLLSMAALWNGAWIAGGILAALALGAVALAARECGMAVAALWGATGSRGPVEGSDV